MLRTPLVALIVSAGVIAFGLLRSSSLSAEHALPSWSKQGVHVAAQAQPSSHAAAPAPHILTRQLLQQAKGSPLSPHVAEAVTAEGCVMGHPTSSRKAWWQYDDRQSLALSDVLVSQGRVYAVFNARTINNKVTAAAWADAQWSIRFHEAENGKANLSASTDGWGFSPHKETFVVHTPLPAHLAGWPSNVPLHVTITAVAPHKAHRTYADVPFCLYPSNGQQTASKVPSNGNQPGTAGPSGATSSSSSSSYQYNLAACTQVLADEARYITEWVVYHHMQGFEHFIVYVNDDSTEVQQVLAPFVEAGLVTIVDWQFNPVYKHKILHQQAQQTSCMLRARGRVKWLSLNDVDEYFQVMQGNVTAAQFLAADSRSQEEGLDGFRLLNWWFGPHAHPMTHAIHRGSMHGCILRTATWVSRGWNHLRYGEREKVIVRPENVAFVNVHKVTAGGPVHILNATSEMRMVHYKQYLRQGKDRSVITELRQDYIDTSMQQYAEPIKQQLTLYCAGNLERCCPTQRAAMQQVHRRQRKSQMSIGFG